MPITGSRSQKTARAYSPASPVMRSLALAAILFLPVAVFAGWFDKLIAPAQKAGSRVVAVGAGTLERAIAHVKSLPAATDGLPLAAQATQEGHWRFVNRAGETFTAGTPDEMKRAVSVLYPHAKGTARLSVYVTEDTIFRRREALRKLPAGAELFVVTGSETYRILHRQEGAVERIFAEVRPGLVVEMSDQRLFHEATWQLARPLDKASVRILALEPNGPSILSTGPRIDKASKRALIDVIDPASLAGAMGSVRGQTLLVTGRVDRDLLYVQPSSGPERSLPLKELFKASEEADVNLIVLHASSTPRQPGGRNWLWLTVEVRGLEQAMQRARMADFLNALAGPNRRLAAIALPVGKRTVLDLTAVGDLPGVGGATPVSDLFSGMVSDITGKVVTTAVQANLRSSERQQEIDHRIVPGIPSSLQFAYFALMALGLLGVPVSRIWWQRIWPQEVATEYAGRSGYRMARLVRGLAYVFVFLPLTAVVAAPRNLLGQIWDGVMTPVRWWRWLTRRGSAPIKPGSVRGNGNSSRPAPGSSARDWPELNAARRLGSTRPSR